MAEARAICSSLPKVHRAQGRWVRGRPQAASWPSWPPSPDAPGPRVAVTSPVSPTSVAETQRSEAVPRAETEQGRGAWDWGRVLGEGPGGPWAGLWGWAYRVPLERWERRREGPPVMQVVGALERPRGLEAAWKQAWEAVREGRTPRKRTRVEGQGRWRGGQAEGTRASSERDQAHPSFFASGRKPGRGPSSPGPGRALLRLRCAAVAGRDSTPRWGPVPALPAAVADLAGLLGLPVCRVGVTAPPALEALRGGSLRLRMRSTRASSPLSAS